jgi:predicted ATPase
VKIESIRLKNFKAFLDVEITNLPQFCVFVGANGTGKSTLFSVFGFLRDAMTSNINTALVKLGGNRGFKEVRSRKSEGPIEVELKFRDRPDTPLTTYFLQIDEKQGGTFEDPFLARHVKEIRWDICGDRDSSRVPIHDKNDRLLSRRTFSPGDAGRAASTHSPP